MTTRTWKQRLSALILALTLTFDVAAQGLVCFADTGETIPETTVATELMVPETTVPETTVPEMTIPEITAPVEPAAEEPTVPETTVPETTVPETTIPEETVPETTIPETTVPEETVPETTVPETTVPEETVPETTVPEMTVPEETVPETTVPETTVPEETVPETTVPETTVPEETEPVMMAPAPEEDTLYTRMLAAESLQIMHDTMMATPEEMFSMTAEELTNLRNRADALYAALEAPTADEEDYYVLLTDTLDMLLGELEMEEPEALDLPAGYIYFDLSQGDVTINQDTYSGKLNGETVTGTHSNTNQYYIFQGNGTSSYTSLPTYGKVTYSGKDWGDYITNHPSRSTAGNDSVDEVITAWNKADKGERKATTNKIKVTTTRSNTQFNVTVDNLWSTWKPTSYTNPDAGLSFQAMGTTLVNDGKNDTYTNCAVNVTVNLAVKGDNRLNRLHCATHDGQNENYRSDKNHTNIINITGDSDATLTLANIAVNKNESYTNAFIGGTDRLDHSFRITLDKITVYAGGGRLDFGTAIGGGGNGPGRVTINGGRITAVNSSTGTAIGGGCGTSGPGGYGEVTINGGSVYAYNYKPHYTSENSTTYTDAIPTAIGGGSSGTQIGGTGIVNITGGYIYAYSEVGNAIGGGGGGNGKTNDSNKYYNTFGGTADVAISGNATVEAVSGTSCAIGGGPGGGRHYKKYADDNGGKLPNATVGSGDMNVPANGDGGTAKLTISGNPTIRSGSIGGGSPLDQNRVYGATVGAAVVNISGGTTHGQIVMDGKIKNVPAEITGLTNGEDSSFTMSGGLIDNAPIDSKYLFVEENGGAVYISSGTATMSGGTIQNCSKINGKDIPYGGAYYIKGGAYTMTGGTVRNCTAANGGAVSISGGDFTMTGGTIDSNTATNEGGAAYVTGGNVIVGTENCTNTKCLTVSNNTAVNGGAFAVAGSTPIMYCGAFSGNVASNHGGAVYVSGEGGFLMHNGIIDGGLDSNGNPKNNAKLGGGIYLSGGDFDMHNGAVQGNTATIDGGGFYVSGGNFTMHNGTIQDNAAPNGNGGGGAVSGGNFTMKAGTIGDLTTEEVEGKTVILPSNTAKNGGGIYVAGGTANVEGGTIQYNRAENGGGTYVTASNSVSGALNLSGNGSFVGNTATVDGGGFYVNGGNFTMNSGSIYSNTATGNGGGGVVQGGKFIMNDGTIGGTSGEGEAQVPLANKATNGGGVYVSGGDFEMYKGTVSHNHASQNGGGINVADGNVTIVYGEIDNNEANANGGGIMVTSSKDNVSVVMLSGSLRNNNAYNGGGMAVDGGGANNHIDIEIGCLMDHKVTAGNPTLPFSYAEDATYNVYAPHKHESCPVVSGNSCTNIGGGFYLASPNSELNFFCVIESGNTAADGKTNCWGMDVQGGAVNIGDSVYHNCNNHTSGVKNKGYIQMGSTILVEGGDVNIYGDMDNPFFQKEITVDIQLGTNGSPLGSYTDHRRDNSDTPTYKVHYVENFPESETVRTGVYIAKQYSFNDSKAVLIDGALFSRPGFSIVGWFIDVKGEELDKEYKVGAKYDLTCKEGNEPYTGSLKPPANSIGITPIDCKDDSGYCKQPDKYLLKLYAKWERTGYTFSFLPGVTEGEWYGTMKDQDFDYNTEDRLNPNAFVYPGYNFVNWKWEAGNQIFEDGAKIYRFTTKNKDKIVLVAQWTVCDHIEDDTRKWSYTAVPVTNPEDPERTQKYIITGTCYCGYKETLTLSAADGIYNKQPHLAKLTPSNTQGFCPGWFENGNYKEPAIIYTPVDFVANNTVKPQLVDGKPVNAGKYTAIVRVGDKLVDGELTGGTTAAVKYTVDKATQAAPTEKPTYAVSETTVTVTGISEVCKVQDAPMGNSAAEPITALAEYRLAYYDTTSKEWKSGSNWIKADSNNTCSLTMMENWTNYRVEVRFEETYNYEPSEPTQANGVYFFNGNVKVNVVSDDHIDAIFNIAGAEQDIKQAILTMTVEEGYFLVDNVFEVAVHVKTTKPGSNNESVTTEKTWDPVIKSPANDSATYQIPDGTVESDATETIITITIGTTQPKASMAVVAQERKIYTDVTGDNTVAIADDSAFTAYFQVDSFDTKVTKDEVSVPVYNGNPVLSFWNIPENNQDKTEVTLPAKTTVLLMDMSGTAKTYWHYKVGADGISEIKLTDFNRMGVENTKYSGAYVDAQAVPATLKYQFVVDFSQCTSVPNAPFTMTMDVKKKAEFQTDYDYIPDLTGTITVTTATPTFSLSASDGNDAMTKQLELKYTSANAASKWENRGSALRLTTSDTLPEDAYFQARIGNSVISSFPIQSGVFLIPLSTLENEKAVSLTLVSEKFPAEDATYTFDVQWRISESLASKAPLNGDTESSGISRLQFKKNADTGVSLKITGNQRIVSTTEPLTVQITSENLNSNLHKVDAILEVETASGSYESFGATLLMPETNNGPMTVVAHQTGAGNYRIKIRVTYQQDAGILLDDIYYYFIAEVPEDPVIPESTRPAG